MTQQARALIVDITKIDGSGPFPCPKCGVILDPEDTSNSVYEMLVPSRLDELLLKCKRCGSKIRITNLGDLTE